MRLLTLQKLLHHDVDDLPHLANSLVQSLIQKVVLLAALLDPACFLGRLKSLLELYIRKADLFTVLGLSNVYCLPPDLFYHLNYFKKQK